MIHFKTVVFKWHGVKEPKLTLLAARQGSKSRDGSLGQGIMTLIRKVADQEEGRLVPQKPSSLSRKSDSFYTGPGGGWGTAAPANV